MNIPADILVEIFCLLDIFSLRSVAYVCRRFYAIVVPRLMLKDFAVVHQGGNGGFLLQGHLIIVGNQEIKSYCPIDGCVKSIQAPYLPCDTNFVYDVSGNTMAVCTADYLCVLQIHCGARETCTNGAKLTGWIKGHALDSSAEVKILGDYVVAVSKKLRLFRGCISSETSHVQTVYNGPAIRDTNNHWRSKPLCIGRHALLPDYIFVLFKTYVKVYHYGTSCQTAYPCVMEWYTSSGPDPCRYIPVLCEAGNLLVLGGYDALHVRECRIDSTLDSRTLDWPAEDYKNSPVRVCYAGDGILYGTRGCQLRAWNLQRRECILSLPLPCGDASVGAIYYVPSQRALFLFKAGRGHKKWVAYNRDDFSESVTFVLQEDIEHVGAGEHLTIMTQNKTLILR